MKNLQKISAWKTIVMAGANRILYVKMAIVIIFISINRVNASVPVPPYLYLKCVESREYCAVSSPMEGIYVYRIFVVGARSELLYKIADWYSDVILSSDGKWLATIDYRLIFNKEDSSPVIKIWENGQLFKAFSWRDVISEDRLISTAPGFFWGQAIRFSEDRTLLIELPDGASKHLAF